MSDFLEISDLELSNKIDAQGLAGRMGDDNSLSVNPDTNISSNSFPNIASTWLLEISYFCSLNNLCCLSIGKLVVISSHLWDSRFNICISVSGYMRAPLGKGRIAVVVPSSGEPFLITTLRTSPGIL